MDALHLHMFIEDDNRRIMTSKLTVAFAAQNRLSGQQTGICQLPVHTELGEC